MCHWIRFPRKPTCKFCTLHSTRRPASTACVPPPQQDGIDMPIYFLQILHDRLQFSFMKPGFLSHSPKKAHSWHWSFLSAQSPSPSRFRRLPLHTSTSTRCVVSHSCSAVITAAWH